MAAALAAAGVTRDRARAFAGLLLFLLLGACARSVEVLAPPAGNPPPVQTNPITFTVKFHPRADVGTFRATIDPPSGPATTDIDITSQFAGPLTPGGQATAVVTVPQTSCALLPVACIDGRRLRVHADMSPSQPFDSLGHDHGFRLPGAPVGTPPPGGGSSPRVGLDVMPMTASAVWGQSATYTIEVESHNGFAGSVALAVDQLPAGVTATPPTSSVTLTAGGPPQTVTLTLSPALAASPPGTTMFRVQATSSALTATSTPSLRIARSDGPFTRATHLFASNTCNATVSASYDTVNKTVQFTAGTDSTQAIPAILYAFSPGGDCRVGISAHPCQTVSCSGAGEPAFSWHNLAWPMATGAPDITDRIGNVTQINWHQFWFSADRSLLLLITKRSQAVTCVPTCPYLDARAFVYDAITGDQIDSVDFRTRAAGSPSSPDVAVTGATLAGTTLTIDFTDRNGFSDSVTATVP